MRFNIKNKKLIIVCIIILIVVTVIVGIYFINRVVNTKNNVLDDNELKDNAYIDIWRDISNDIDITLYSTGSGKNEKIYLGQQPTHYLINKSGDVYTYIDSSYKNKITGKRDPATVKYIKHLSQSDLEKLENDLKSIIENNNINSNSLNSTYWYIKMNDQTIKVDVNLKSVVLDNYL